MATTNVMINPTWAQVQLFILKNKDVQPEWLIKEKLHNWIAEQQNKESFKQQLINLTYSIEGTKDATGNGWKVLYDWREDKNNWPLRGEAIMPDEMIKKIYEKFCEYWPDGETSFADFRSRLIRGAHTPQLIPKGKPGCIDEYTGARKFIKAFHRYIKNKKIYQLQNAQQHFKQNFGVRSTDAGDLTPFEEFFDALENG